MKFRNNKTNQLQKKNCERKTFLDNLKAVKKKKKLLFSARHARVKKSAVRVSCNFQLSSSQSLINIDIFVSYTLESGNKLRLSIVFSFGECKQKIYLWRGDREWHWSLSFVRRLRSASYWTLRNSVHKQLRTFLSVAQYRDGKFTSS